METPQSINLWAEQTFPPRDPLTVASRGNIELSELVSALINNADKEEIASEIADVFIVLCQVSELLGVNYSLILDFLEEDIALFEKKYPDINSIGTSIRLGSFCYELMYFIDMSVSSEYENIFRKIYTLIHKFVRLEEIDLQAEVDKKMQINRARQWKQTKSGHFQHT